MTATFETMPPAQKKNQRKVAFAALIGTTNGPRDCDAQI